MAKEEMKSSNKKRMGVRLALLRKNRKITQGELSEILKCSSQNISGWETGRNLIPTNYLLLICKELNVELNYFDTNIQGPEGKLEVCSSCKSESWSHTK